jgi:hypothetical protein
MVEQRLRNLASCVCPAVRPSRIGSPARRRRRGSWS